MVPLIGDHTNLIVYHDNKNKPIISDTYIDSIEITKINLWTRISTKSVLRN